MKKKLILFILILFSVNLYSGEDTIKSDNTLNNDTIKIPIIYISDFEGRFININKKENENYYDLMRKIKYFQNILPILNHWERAITLNNGSTFWPSTSIKYIFKQEKGIDLVYSLLKENNFDIINIGKKDLYTPYKIMEKLSENKDILSLPFLSSNMDCSNSKTLPICQLVKNKKYKILKINGLRIGLISVISENILSKSFYKSVKDLKIKSELEESNRLAKKLKEEKKVDIVILMAQIEDRETSPLETISMSDNLKNVDLIISNAENTKLIKKYNNDIYITGTNPNRYEPNLLLLEIKEVNNKYKISSIENLNERYDYKVNVPSAYKHFLDNYRENYFRKYDVPINNMKIVDMPFKEFYTFILKLMIKETESELALINKKNFNMSLFPINKLTFDIIEKAITYNNRLATFKISGDLLKRFLDKNKNNLLFSNITFDKNIKINGYKIIDKKKYKVVTTEFIANGGDGFFKNEFFIKDKKYYTKLKDLFNEYLKKEKFKKANSKFSSDLEFEDLSKNFLWESYNNLGFYYIKSDVKNDSSYEKVKFTNIPIELLKIDGDFNLKARSMYHIIENKFEVHYYQSAENNLDIKESNDLVSYSLNYKNNYFKYKNNGNNFTPLPYFEGKINTELTELDKDNRYVELFLSAGTSFLTLDDDKLELKLGLQGSKDFKSDKTQLGVIVGYKLNDYQISSLDIPIKITSETNYFWGFDNTNIMDFQFTINIPILGLFHLSNKIDSYIYKEKDNNWSYYYNIFFGINIIYNNWF